MILNLFNIIIIAKIRKRQWNKKKVKIKINKWVMLLSSQIWDVYFTASKKKRLFVDQDRIHEVLVEKVMVYVINQIKDNKLESDIDIMSNCSI